MTYVFLGVTGVLGLAIGVWLGMPGTWTQTQEDIDELMEKGGPARRRLKKRSVNPLAWMHRKANARTGSRDRRKGRGRSKFTLELPDEK